MSEGTEMRVELCRCEQVSLAVAERAIAEGARTFNDVKRRTRAGMGICQGVYCTRAIAQLLLQAGVPQAEIGPMRPRPPARSTPIADLAALPQVASVSPGWRDALCRWHAHARVARTAGMRFVRIARL